MGKIGKIFGMLSVTCLFMFTQEACAYLPYDNADPRVQQRDHKVMMTFLNKEEVLYTVKVFSPKNRLIRKEVLGDAIVVGKILDFEHSQRGVYRVQVLTEGEILFDKRMRLGTL